MKDTKIRSLIKEERRRQNNVLELIASENFVSKEVMKATGSVLTNKYAEGYPDYRYYGGCKVIDRVENIARFRANYLFGTKFANVQPHSGSQANAAAYRALEKLLLEEGKLKAGERMRILATKLNDGGHLTHGSNVSFSANTYDFSFFDLNEEGKIDLELIEKEIIFKQPHVLLIGYSAYPYDIPFSIIKDLVDKYEIKFMVDMAHIAGIVAAKLCENPCKYADVVTSTTHKTLRGPRGGLILTNNAELAKYIDSAVFPYYQGGPLEHVIAAKAVCFLEASTTAFSRYMVNVVANTKAFTKRMKELGAVCSDTNNHLMLLNVKETFGMTGKEAQDKLEQIGITVNKNMIPKDTLSPKETSGLRIGFAAATTRGLTSKQAIEIADIIYCYLKTYNCLAIMDDIELYSKKVRKIVKTLERI